MDVSSDSLLSLNSQDDLRAVLDALASSRLVRIWTMFAAFVAAIYWFCSSGDFSFLLTLCSLVNVFSFFLVFVTIMSTRSVQGVSLKMMECYILIFLCRLWAIVPFQGYLPLDRSGDWFYQSCEAFGLFLACAIVHCIRARFCCTYDSHSDTFEVCWIIAPALIIAILLHPHMNDHWPSDVAWAFALYLEAVTVLPQFMMFMKEGHAQPHISHFLAAQALARLLTFVFWGYSFTELSNSGPGGHQFVGSWVIGIQLLQLVVMGDFIYHYVRALQKGIPMADVIAYYSSNV